VEFVNEK